MLEKIEVTRQENIFYIYAIFHPAAVEVTCLLLLKVLWLCPQGLCCHYPFSFLYHFFFLYWISIIRVQTHSSRPNFLRIETFLTLCLSLLCIPRIFVLRVISKCSLHFLTSHSLLSLFQTGFQTHHPTETAIVSINIGHNLLHPIITVWSSF